MADDAVVVVVLEVSKSSPPPPLPPLVVTLGPSSGPSGEVSPSNMLATRVSCSCISAPASDQGMEVWSPPNKSESDLGAECEDPVGLSGGPSNDPLPPMMGG